ncbi:MAG: helix-turn-helix domain-containing protein [Pleomorphochaeta sp.]
MKEARLNNGITQQELALRTNTTKSTISRMENHAEDIKISTLEKVANAIGKKIKISFV